MSPLSPCKAPFSIIFWLKTQAFPAEAKPHEDSFAAWLRNPQTSAFFPIRVIYLNLLRPMP